MRRRISAAAVMARPDDVSQGVWDDWLAHRKRKKADASPTTVEHARQEAAKAGIPLERFLTIWCFRGSQGLKAAWLTPDELGADASGSQPGAPRTFGTTNFNKGIAADGRIDL